MRNHSTRPRSLWITAASIGAAATPVPAGVYATSLDGCIAAGYAASKLVVAGDNAGLCRCEGANPSAQAMLDLSWRDQVTRGALQSIHAFISTAPDFDITTHDAEGITYTLSSRVDGADRFIDILGWSMSALQRSSVRKPS